MDGAVDAAAPLQLSFAALTIASTDSVVMSATMMSSRVVPISAVRRGESWLRTYRGQAREATARSGGVRRSSPGCEARISVS